MKCFNITVSIMVFVASINLVEASRIGANQSFKNLTGNRSFSVPFNNHQFTKPFVPASKIVLPTDNTLQKQVETTSTGSSFLSTLLFSKNSQPIAPQSTSISAPVKSLLESFTVTDHNPSTTSINSNNSSSIFVPKSALVKESAAPVEFNLGDSTISTDAQSLNSAQGNVNVQPNLTFNFQPKYLMVENGPQDPVAQSNVSLTTDTTDTATQNSNISLTTDGVIPTQQTMTTWLPQSLQQFVSKPVQAPTEFNLDNSVVSHTMNPVSNVNISNSPMISSYPVEAALKENSKQLEITPEITSNYAIAKQNGFFPNTNKKTSSVSQAPIILSRQQVNDMLVQLSMQDRNNLRDILINVPKNKPLIINRKSNQPPLEISSSNVSAVLKMLEDTPQKKTAPLLLTNGADAFVITTNPSSTQTTTSASKAIVNVSPLEIKIPEPINLPVDNVIGVAQDGIPGEIDPTIAEPVKIVIDAEAANFSSIPVPASTLASIKARLGEAKNRILSAFGFTPKDVSLVQEIAIDGVVSDTAQAVVDQTSSKSYSQIFSEMAQKIWDIMRFKPLSTLTPVAAA